MLQRKKYKIQFHPRPSYTNVIFPGRFDPKFSSVLKMERELPEDQVTYCIVIVAVVGAVTVVVIAVVVV